MNLYLIEKNALVCGSSKGIGKAILNHLVCNQVLVQAVASGMKREGYGRIVNIISTSVKTPLMGLGVSNTVRAAVANWAKTMANELGQFYFLSKKLNRIIKNERLDYKR